mgnify:CR=1 FL=1
MEKCRVCEIELNAINWFPSLKKRGSLICKKCNNDKMSLWRADNRERANKMALKHYRKDPKKHHDSVHKARVKVRVEMIVAYGGKCNHCAISDIEVLDIDHIDNSGASDRKNNLHGYNLYRKLKKEGFPKENFQLLCKNCNWKKHLANIKK